MCARWTYCRTVLSCKIAATPSQSASNNSSVWHYFPVLLQYCALINRWELNIRERKILKLLVGAGMGNMNIWNLTIQIIDFYGLPSDAFIPRVQCTNQCAIYQEWIAICVHVQISNEEESETEMIKIVIIVESCLDWDIECGGIISPAESPLQVGLRGKRLWWIANSQRWISCLLLMTWWPPPRWDLICSRQLRMRIVAGADCGTGQLSL